ncbi:flagellar biosynthesis protein FlhF [Paenibacillus glacialis]|uniref:Flagellar biosynthesis protein FlhF n=1 Tax=Paenibacillus glacialis TaxID=494026 RepID=A0A168K0K4_9BACL|nr:flagellar biosynthesis protein FlhF [Paenibacillus glacialis]OAB41352.1 flagellar biosynthesis protein FlhF [Paenibacillus glacialis]
MRVRRYIVEHMPDAMQRIRSELGRDAVILSTKEIKIGGFLGMFKKKRIEVVAAVEKEAKVNSVSENKPSGHYNDELRDVNSIKSTPKAGPSTMSVPYKAVPEAYKRTNAVLKAGMNDVADDLETSFLSAAATSEVQKPDQDSPLSSSLFKGDITERHHSDTSNKMIDQTVSNEPILQEIKEMKLWMAKMAKHSMMKQELPDSLQRLQEQLIQQEVDIHLRAEWIEAAFEKWEDSGHSLTDDQLQQFIYDKAYSFLSNRFGGGIEANTRIVYVAGPTGVGKTTTIAKLAAEQLFRYQRKVGFITSDTYRISAVEQLRTYASILNVPLEVVQSPGDMQRALQRLDYCDLILMDTAGRNYRNELLVSELQSLLSHAGDSETYLVLSLTSKSQDMMKITEHFSKYGLDKVIFTKLDETGSYGTIFNLLNNFPLHLSYMTNGQNVPDDVIMPNQKMLCDLLLGEREDSHE